MICPHCKKRLIISVKRAKSERNEYWVKRHINSGRAKVRQSLDMVGKCIDCGGDDVEGASWRCRKCKRNRKQAQDREYDIRRMRREVAA